ncbi:hypothetical protein [Gordonia phthalatica]|uniref:Uncharacterized protein n=1 Tax=Gordonia phthalatica TaxID=1136941 RepID=A0A0N9NBS5_9ACTN|nr:hypothetical protein [Gordonia phthalatica]ALG84466.1 hypothetical protein ACH46_08110 [Gordonia phthalatica]
MDQLLVPVGMTVVVLCVIAVALCVVSMAFSHGLKRPKINEYSLDQKWENGPLLFSATEIQPMALSRHFEPGDIEGGSASGKW